MIGIKTSAYCKGAVVADKGLVGCAVGWKPAGILKGVGMTQLELVSGAGHGHERQEASGNPHV